MDMKRRAPTELTVTSSILHRGAMTKFNFLFLLGSLPSEKPKHIPFPDAKNMCKNMAPSCEDRLVGLPFKKIRLLDYQHGEV